MNANWRDRREGSSAWKSPGCWVPLSIWATAHLALVAAGEAAFTPTPGFTISPLDVQEVCEIIPLGNLNPRSGHVFPTDHIYFDYGRKPDLPVRAPADGTVLAVYDQSGGDLKIEMRVDRHLCYYLGHIFVEPGIGKGSHVKAGQVVGRASGRSALDLGAYDDRVRLPGLINPWRYPTSTLQTISPLALFAEPVKSQLYAKVTREGPDKDGKIDFDQRGRLVGNWFHESLSADDSSRGTPETWSRQLAFVYDVRKPTAVRIAIGGTLAPAGTYSVPVGAPDPADVSAETGLVKYQLLRPTEGRSSRGADEKVRRADPRLLLVQVLRDGRLKAECCEGKTPAEVDGFTSAALIYER